MEEDSFRKEKLKERLWKLTGKIANIKVWGASQTEQSEIKYRIEDALNATKTAIEDGIVEWAWTALVRCIDSLNIDSVNREFDAWVDIVKQALSAPFKKIISNGWENADAILWKVVESKNGYNSLTQEYVDLFKDWVIDPKKVVEQEIINAVSTAWILLTSSVAISSIEDKK
jgi:chaperonin GroEL